MLHAYVITHLRRQAEADELIRFRETIIRELRRMPKHHTGLQWHRDRLVTLRRLERRLANLGVSN